MVIVTSSVENPTYGVFVRSGLIAAGWTVRGSNFFWGRDFIAPVQTGPWAHPATMVTGSFPGVKQPGRVVDHHI